MTKKQKNLPLSRATLLYPEELLRHWDRTRVTQLGPPKDPPRQARQWGQVSPSWAHQREPPETSETMGTNACHPQPAEGSPHCLACLPAFPATPPPPAPPPNQPKIVPIVSPVSLHSPRPLPHQRLRAATMLSCRYQVATMLLPCSPAPAW